MNQKEVVVFAPLWKKLPVDGYGGIEQVTLERVKYLRKIGYKVQLIANTDDFSLADEVLQIQKLFKFPKSKVDHLNWFLSFKWTNYLSSFSKISDMIWEAPILSDATAMDPFNNYFLAYSLGIKRVLYYLHGNHYLTNGIAKPLYYPIDKITNASLRVNYGSLNTRLAYHLKNRGFRCSYMPNGITFQNFPKVVQEHGNYLLFVGILNRKKAPHLAIEIAKKLSLPLRIVGPIGDRQYFDSILKGHIGKNVEYLGEIPRNELNKEFAKAYGFIFTSQWDDPQPSVVLEATSWGIPVIALNPGYFSGTYDMVENFVNGFIGTMDEMILNAKNALDIDRYTLYITEKEKWSWEYILKTYHVPVIEKMREDYETRSYKSKDNSSRI